MNDPNTLYMIVTMVSCLLSLVVGAGIVAALVLLRRHPTDEYEYMVIQDVPDKMIKELIVPLLNGNWEFCSPPKASSVVQGYTTFFLRHRKGR